MASTINILQSSHEDDHEWGQYYEMFFKSIIDKSKSIIDDSREILQLAASFTMVICYQYIFIEQANVWFEEPQKKLLKN